MTESELTTCANEKIDRILFEIDERQLKQRFDDPVDAVLEQFSCEPDYPVNYQRFKEIVVEFVEKVYTDALKKLFEGPTVLAVAIELLEEYYQGLYASGYTAALMDANDRDNGGMYVVLAGLAEAIKTLHRQTYIKHVFARYTGSNNWRLQQRITKILLERYEPYLPAFLKTVNPAQITSQIPAIIQSYTASVGCFERMSGS